MSFFEELKRRNVFKVGITYVVGTWILVQVADILFENIGTPDWVMQTMLVFLGIGFFVALFFAWAFEMTPEGIKREHEIDRSQSITPQTGKKLNNAIVVLLAVAVAYLLFDKFTGSDPFSQEHAQQEPVDVGEERALTPELPAIDPKSIAVLPFENRSPNPNDAFFTEGIHDDLLSNLARIGSLKVISRTSVAQYKGTQKTIPVIARELGVATVLEGAVQRAGNSVRINVQLIDAQTDKHLWAEIFDRELTAENLFAIQSEISQAIADALQATLSPAETRRINTTPTDNLLAYDAYLKGRQLMATRQSAKLEQAILEFNKAVELDPQFALAWIGVADSNFLLSTYGTLRLEDSNPIREVAIERAMAIDDQLGEAYAALGSLLEQTNRQAEAETAYQKAIELSPNYATAWHWYANFLTGYPLRSQEAMELARKAVELDPRSMIIGAMLGGAYVAQGLYALAERQFQKVAELNPGFAQAHNSLVFLYIFATGEFDKAVVASRKASALDPGNTSTLLVQALIYLELGDIAAAEAVRTQIEEVDNEHWTLGITDINIANAHKNPAAAGEAINWVLPKLRNNPSFANIAALTTLIHGDVKRAREMYLVINPGWLDPGHWQDLIGQDSRTACIFSWLLINTGDQTLGEQLLNQTTEYLDIDLAAVNEHVDALSPDICYLVAGETEKALNSIETQLSHNHLFYWDVGHQLPMYDLIRFEPRYQAALAERKRRIAIQREAVAQLDAETGP